LVAVMTQTVNSCALQFSVPIAFSSNCICHRQKMRRCTALHCTAGQPTAHKAATMATEQARRPAPDTTASIPPKGQFSCRTAATTHERRIANQRMPTLRFRRNMYAIATWRTASPISI
jgi:hypothetical protein